MVALAPVRLGWARRGKAARGASPDFRALVGERGWADLPPAVRARFAHEAERSYPGAMTVRASAYGQFLAQVCRLIGTPLAPWTGEAVPVSVRVWLDAGGALVWDRTYRFDGRAPLLVSSRKVCDRAGALMEIARGGLGMWLTTSVESGVLRFRSTGYFWSLFGVRLQIPGLLTPGEADVIHRDEGCGRFTFAIRFVHPLFGETIFQSGVFEDPS